MEMILGLLNFILFIALIVGLVKPALILRWTNKPTRLKVFGYWILSFIVIIFLGSMFVDTEPNPKKDIGVSYEFKITQDDYPYKITYEIDLDKRVDEELIKKVSEEIKTGKNYKKIFMFYNIPNWNWDGGGSWATSHYTPELEINILGATIEQVKKINSIVVDGKIKGEWWQSTQYFEGRVLETEKNNKNFINQIMGDGSIITDQVKIKKVGETVRFIPLKKKEEYWVLEKNGNLSVNDNSGKIWEAKAIKKSPN
jgi:hypothetical protein